MLPANIKEPWKLRHPPIKLGMPFKIDELMEMILIDSDGEVMSMIISKELIKRVLVFVLLLSIIINPLSNVQATTKVKVKLSNKKVVIGGRSGKGNNS